MAFYLLFFLITALHAQTPAPTQADLEKLVQQEKWTEAAQAVETLLKASPDDATLKGYKDEITKHLIATTPPLVRPTTAPVAEEKIDTFSDEDRLEWNTLTLMGRNAQSKTDAERHAAMAELLDKSTPFSVKHPGFPGVWQLRAIAALELNQPKIGWEAGQKLKALGALKSTDPAVGELMANLNLKGWLAADYADVEKAQQTASDKIADENKKKWIGTWTGEISGSGFATGLQADWNRRKNTILKIDEKDQVQIEMARHDTMTSRNYGSTAHVSVIEKIPGTSSFSSTSETSSTKDTASNTLTKVFFSHQNLILHVEYSTTNLLANQAITKNEMLFLLDPSGNRVSGDDAKIDLQKTVDQNLKELPQVDGEAIPHEINGINLKIYWLKKQ